ncbi:hypothetical protein Ahy_A06g027710 [Arachis hypogaea]|uniref:PB1-like domain-containing protein n=1 Tax=Arachis hypogaea TaxID=3818 RepID=A0A445CPI6_ARAHY|nr:hypothetical protein Ahy_A06g027710 [Arachis hypogaea]
MVSIAKDNDDRLGQCCLIADFFHWRKFRGKLLKQRVENRLSYLEGIGSGLLIDVEVLDIMFHHGRNFEKGKDGRWTYYPDNKHCLGEVDVDRLDVFYLKNYFKELGYKKMKLVWWLVPGRSLKVGLRRLNTDNELRKMCFYVIDVYIEHEISKTEILQGQDVIVHLDDQVRDLGEQAKSNATTIRNHFSKTTTEKLPPLIVSIVTNTSQDKEIVPRPINFNSKLKPKPKIVPKCTPIQNKVDGGDTVVLSSDSNSHDNYENVEDEAYKPVFLEDSSGESGIRDKIPSSKNELRKYNVRKKVQQESGKEKGKDKVCVDDDAFVEDVSDEEVDIGFVGRAMKILGVERFTTGMRTSNYLSRIQRIPCVHVCAAFARVNKHSKDFCHKLITIESYKEIYKYHINPLPGQPFWE